MNKRYLAPRYWGIWLLIGLMRLVVLLPYSWQLFLGRCFGRISLYFAPHRRHVTDINLKLCFPQLSAAEHRKLMVRCFESVGMGMMETAMAWWMPTRRLRGRLKVYGIEHLHQALQQNANIVVLGGHYTCLEIVGRLFTFENLPFHLMYREHTNPLFNALMIKKRSQYIQQIIPRTHLREFIRSIRSKVPTWYAPDQDYGRQHSVFAPFFGIPTATITVLSRLIDSKTSVVIPASYHRLENHQGYEIIFHPPLPHFPSGNDLEDATQINHLLEIDLKAHPEQYLWQHRRFKTRPVGSYKFY